MANIIFEESWIGIDLDGTLAMYKEWGGIAHIGPPVRRTLSLVEALMTNGHTVKIFTARVANGEEAIRYIQEWSKKHIGTTLEVTNVKTPGCILLIDDRAAHCGFNTGHVNYQDVEKILNRGKLREQLRDRVKPRDDMRGGSLG